MSTTVLAVANQKGGVGKTTTSINLSAGLAERKKRVLLVDLDPQANATSGLGMEKTEGKSIYHALLGDSDACNLIVQTNFNRLDLIPSELDLAGAEVDIARMDNYLHCLRTALRPVSENAAYDFIVLDCPPSLGILTMNALATASSVLIPMQCEYFALEGLSVMVRLIEQIRQSRANPELELGGIVMTMYDTRTNLSQQVVQEVATHFGDKVYETLIPRTVRLSESPSYGKPIMEYDPHCTGSAAYRQLAREVIQRYAPSAKPVSNQISLTPSRDVPSQLIQPHGDLDRNSVDATNEAQAAMPEAQTVRQTENN